MLNFFTYLLEVPAFGQQHIVDMYEARILARARFDPVPRFGVDIFVTRILRTINVHFEGTFKVPVASTTVTKTFGNEFLPGVDRPCHQARIGPPVFDQHRWVQKVG